MRSAVQKPARYREIAAYLSELVSEGEPGDRLPSDAELCERFGVSRMTARHAVQLLVAEGRVVRRRGRGTFIATRRVARMLGSPLSFTESMRRRGCEASSQVLALGSTDPSPEDVEALGLDPGERPVLLERLRLADGVPMAIETAVITPRCADVLEEDLSTGSLHDAFERLGHVPARALAQVTARRVRSRERDLLDLPGSGVVVTERRVIFDQEGLPLEHTETCYAAERYQFEAVLYRHDGTGE
jgi:GntR family transcriptional regulator